MTDFEKIIKVTRMAKEYADKGKQLAKNNNPSALAVLGHVLSIWADFRVIDGMFEGGKERSIAIQWYGTVESLRMN